MNSPLWVMHIPVISTQHMPSEHSLVHLATNGVLVANTDEGGFVLLQELMEDWTTPILTWLQEHFGDDTNWVRFDADADVIEGLRVYDWSPM